MAKRTTKTEVVTKTFARSGPEIRPDQIRLADEAQVDPNKVYTQSDINQNAGGGAIPDPIDLDGYAKTDYVDSADQALNTLIAANAQAIEDIDISEGGESYDDTAIKNDIADLQGAFDTAVLAAQEGAENLEIDLQSYAKKEDSVSKTGGDSMQGPLAVQAQDGTNGRDTNKVQTLGVFSNSDGSALRLGTTRDRVYVGHNDTSFNGPIKVDEIQEKNTGSGTIFKNIVCAESPLSIRIKDPNSIIIDHPDYVADNRVPLKVFDPNETCRFGVKIENGKGPYAIDEHGQAFQGEHVNYLATIGLLKGKAVTEYYYGLRGELGALDLQIVKSLSASRDVDPAVALITDDYSYLVLNHDPKGAGGGVGRVDWISNFPDDSTMYIQQGEAVYMLETTAVGSAGLNGRAKHFIIRSHSIPDNALSDAEITIGSYVEDGNTPYLTSYAKHKALEKTTLSLNGGTVKGVLSVDGEDDNPFLAKANNDVVTKAYLNQQNSDYAAKNHSHQPKSLWVAVSHKVAENLERGEFFIGDDDNIYFHRYTATNVDFGVNGSAIDGLVFLCTVHNSIGNSVHCITADQISVNNGENNYSMVRKKAKHYGEGAYTGERYFLNIPGFTF